MRQPLLAMAAAVSVATLAISSVQADHHAASEIDTSAIADGSYSADPGHSMVVWSLSHLGFNDYYGIFGDVAGTLELDTADLAQSSVDVTIPIASVTVPSAGLKDHLLRDGKEGAAPDFFGSEPVAARFVSTTVTPTGDTTADITGDLTLNGVTRPVTVKAKLSGTGTNGMNRKATVGFHGKASIMRSDFNVSYGIPFGLEDKVDLKITVAFEKD